MRFFRSTARPPRLFILGLDGSPLPLLRELMSAGDLPNLARAFEGGSAVEMDSSLPDVSAVAWTSVNTGKNPGKHGIYGFVDRKPGTNQMEVMTARHVRAKTIWELVSDAGRRAVAINVPLSFPPQRINGVVVSDFLAPSLDKAVYPTTVLPALQNLGYRIDTDPWVARQSLDAFLEDFRVTAERRADAVLHLMEQEAWDLFMVVFMETDRLHHFMWKYYAEGEQPYAEKFKDAYRQIDQAAGRILKKLGDEPLIIMSDHGFTSLREEVFINVWLEQEGFLAFQPGAEKGLGTFASVTRAYSLDPGRIYVNLEGREPGGTVPASEFGLVLDDLIPRLRDLRDPKTGERMIEHVFRAGEIYDGPQRDRAPDILAMPFDGYDLKGTFDGTELTGHGPLVGMHKFDNATFFVRGHEITVPHATVRDVLPTACQIMNVPCPSDVDGRVIVKQ